MYSVFRMRFTFLYTLLYTPEWILSHRCLYLFICSTGTHNTFATSLCLQCIHIINCKSSIESYFRVANLFEIIPRKKTRPWIVAWGLCSVHVYAPIKRIHTSIYCTAIIWNIQESNIDIWIMEMMITKKKCSVIQICMRVMIFARVFECLIVDLQFFSLRILADINDKLSEGNSHKARSNVCSKFSLAIWDMIMFRRQLRNRPNWYIQSQYICCKIMIVGTQGIGVIQIWNTLN